MAFDGNGEVETATRLVDEALAIDPDSQLARYVRARVIWCGAGDTEQAVVTFEGLLAETDLAAETRAQVETDLTAARAGEGCP
jgi:cytochrome c-type biogenesis protein CcmH/NrfG